MLCLLAGPVAAAGFGAPEAAPRAARRALLIGIDAYDDPAFPPLRFARADAEAFAATLRDARYGGFDQVDLLVEGDLSAQAVLERIAAFGAALGPDDLGLVYFSGHGTRWVDARGRGHAFLATQDTVRADPLGTAIPMDALQDQLGTWAASRRVFVLDACLTGDGKVDEEDAAAAARAAVDDELPFRARFSEHEAQLFATTWGKPALESRAVGHGVYTWHLVQALSERFDEADLNQDLVVTASEAHDHARDQTLRATASAQVPMAFYKVVGREDIVLSGDPNSRRRVEAALVSAYSGPQEGIALLVDGEARGAFPRTVLVDPGDHTVEFRSPTGKVIDRGRFRFRPGQIYDAARIRDALNGGRHRLSLGYAHLWMPGVAWRTAHVPSAPGLRVGYGLRIGGRNPVLRRFGADVDLGLHVVAPQALAADAGVTGNSPLSLVWDLGVGPTVHLDVPYAAFSLRPRFGVAGIQRLTAAEAPFFHWVIGTLGAEVSAGFRTAARVTIQARYAAVGFNVPLAADFLDGTPAPKPGVLHRLTGGVEIGF